MTALKIEFVRSEPNLRYVWPSADAEDYAPLDIYRVNDGIHRGEFGIAYGWRQAFDAKRRRVVVFLLDPMWSAVEFAGTDAYASDKSLVWIIKRPGGNKRYGANESPDSSFADFPQVIHREYVVGRNAFSGWAVLLAEGDKAKMVRLAWVRARHRGYFQD